VTSKTCDRAGPFGEISDMWQVYLYLANERQAIEHREAARRPIAGGSRIRRWRNARRTTGVTGTQRTVTQGR
jgi:hypothetical protein